VYGCSYVDDTVMPNPRWLVTAAIAETASMGSFTGICAASMIAASALPWYTSWMPRTSAMNRLSKKPRSRTWARPVQYSRSL
jgi:hypothetical protein